MSPSITGRTAPKAAPAVMTAATPAMAAAEPESELIRGLRQWRADHQALNDQRPPGMSDDEFGVVVELSTARLEALLAISAETMQEVAMKVIMSDIDAGRNLQHLSGVMTQELYRLARFDDRAPTVGVFPSVPPESEIMRLFREWKRAEFAMKEPGTPDDVWEERWDARNRAGEALANAETRSVADLALKIIAVEYTGGGGVSNLDTGDDLVREACEIVGMEHMLCDRGDGGIIALTT